MTFSMTYLFSIFTKGIPDTGFRLIPFPEVEILVPGCITSPCTQNLNKGVHWNNKKPVEELHV